MAKKRCRHSKAWPTMFYQKVGFMWCPDCGAVRCIKSHPADAAEPVGFVFAEPKWRVPGKTHD